MACKSKDSWRNFKKENEEKAALSKNENKLSGIDSVASNTVAKTNTALPKKSSKIKSAKNVTKAKNKVIKK